MARKTKYSPERVETICQAIAESGLDSAGYESAGISHQTFHVWLNEKPEFLERVAQARKTYAENAPKYLKSKALATIKQGLEGFTITRKRTSTRRLNHYVPTDDGEVLKWFQEETIEEFNEDKMPPSPWAVNKVFPDAPADLEAAIKLIEAHGLKAVVADAELFKEWIAQTQAFSEDSEGGSRTGISEETANEIRTRILGVPENAARSSSLSSEMD